MLKSWKTTVTGIVAIIVAGLVQQGHISAETGATITGIIVGILGIVSKDSGVSGPGT